MKILRTQEIPTQRKGINPPWKFRMEESELINFATQEIETRQEAQVANTRNFPLLDDVDLETSSSRQFWTTLAHRTNPFDKDQLMNIHASECHAIDLVILQKRLHAPGSPLGLIEYTHARSRELNDLLSMRKIGIDIDSSRMAPRNWELAPELTYQLQGIDHAINGLLATSLADEESFRDHTPFKSVEELSEYAGLYGLQVDYNALQIGFRTLLDEPRIAQKDESYLESLSWWLLDVTQATLKCNQLTSITNLTAFPFKETRPENLNHLPAEIFPHMVRIITDFVINLPELIPEGSQYPFMTLHNKTVGLHSAINRQLQDRIDVQKVFVKCQSEMQEHARITEQCLVMYQRDPNLLRDSSKKNESDRSTLLKLQELRQRIQDNGGRARSIKSYKRSFKRTFIDAEN